MTGLALIPTPPYVAVVQQPYRGAYAPRYALVGQLSERRRRTQQEVIRTCLPQGTKLLVSDVLGIRERWALNLLVRRGAGRLSMRAFALREQSALAVQHVVVSDITIRDVVAGYSWSWV